MNDKERTYIIVYWKEGIRTRPEVSLFADPTSKSVRYENGIIRICTMFSIQCIPITSIEYIEKRTMTEEDYSTIMDKHKLLGGVQPSTKIHADVYICNNEV